MELYAEPEFNPDLLTLSQLRGRRVHQPDQTARMPLHDLRDLVKRTHGQNLGDLEFELTARHPYADAGFLDFLDPARWDCTGDLVYMEAIHDISTTIGEWVGTVGYGRFTATTDGQYIVVVNFSGGWGQTMRLRGPWETISVRTVSGESTAATALWTGKAGESVLPDFSSKSDHGGTGIVFFNSFQIFQTVRGEA